MKNPSHGVRLRHGQHIAGSLTMARLMTEFGPLPVSSLFVVFGAKESLNESSKPRLSMPDHAAPRYWKRTL
jgi:hypothetical protein